MAILNNSNAISSGGYDINNSLRFRSSASAYLSRTPSAGNRNTWTWSGWVKKTPLASGVQAMIAAGTTSVVYDDFCFENDQIRVVFNNGTYDVKTTQVFRDPSAWYHVIVAMDTTQATASNRVKIYVNGSQVTAFATANYPAQNHNTNINNNILNTIGNLYNGSFSSYFDGYMTEVNFIDGQALAPSSFGETDTTTGVWKPKAYTSTYGTNGFYLKFSDIATTSGSNAGLGKDFSGNGNYFNTNNISVTAGTTYDAMIDSPTLTSATVANYCVLNPLDTGSNITLSAANLQTSQGASAGISKGTIGISSGKWYWEVTLLSGTTAVGIADITSSRTQSYVGQTSTSYGYYSGTGSKYNNATGVAYGATYTTNDVIGVALDMDAGTLTFYKNNTSQGTAYSSLSGTFTPAIGNDQSNTTAFNAGQRPFTYTPPSGFVRLNAYNLPDSTIKKGNTVMDATLYTGTGSALTVTNAGAFKPDFVWAKNRSAADSSGLYDSVRGVDKRLISNLTNAEDTSSGVSAFNSNGFSLGTAANYNTNGNSFVGWQWQAGQGTTSSNTSGSITSTVSVNTTAGFSIVSFTTVASTNSTVGHGLGVAPKMIIVRYRSATSSWFIWHTSLTSGSYYVALDSTAAQASIPTLWNSTIPTSSVFSLGTAWTTSAASIAYCFAEIAGFSKFGSYTGNGSTDGTFVYTGFRPKYVLLKSTGVENWFVFDSSRNTYNVTTARLYPALSNAEDTNLNTLDLLSNGFKFRDTNVAWNGSGTTYIFMAFAENPFKNALAR